MRERRPLAPDSYRFGAEEPLEWDAVVERIVQAEFYWLATVNPNGAPHVAPLWSIWSDGALFFDGHPSTRWARNLSRDPRASVHLESAAAAVILDGRVDDCVTDEHQGRAIVEGWRTKYGEDLLPEPTERGMFRFRPTKVKAWGATLGDGVVWTLQD